MRAAAGPQAATAVTAEQGQSLGFSSVPPSTEVVMGKRARAQSRWRLHSRFSPGAVIRKGDKLGHVQEVCHVQGKPRLAVPFL